MVRCGGVFDRRAELIERLRRGPVPAAAGKPAATRWTLARVAAALPWLAGYSLSGVWKLLRGSGIRLRSARVQAYSPDPDYEQKVEHLCAVLREASHAPGERVVVFVDQMGYGRWPQAASDWLPTYAPWLNPIEKLWRWVRQDALYLHRDAGDWNTLQQHLHAFLEQFAAGSTEVLEYVGLLGDGLLAQARRGR